jgi:hypothetical protein
MPTRVERELPGSFPRTRVEEIRARCRAMTDRTPGAATSMDVRCAAGRDGAIWTTRYRGFARYPTPQPLARQLPAKSSCALVHEYTSHSTVHGMRYITRANLVEK